MNVAIPWVLVFSTFLTAVWVSFAGLLDVTTKQTTAVEQARELQYERVRTLVSITSTSSSGDEHTAMVLNRSDGVSFGDYSNLDIFTRYSTATGDRVAKRLEHISEWNVSSITPDNADPNIWDPDETATITFTLVPKIKDCTKGTLAVAVPGGISHSSYFGPTC